MRKKILLLTLTLSAVMLNLRSALTKRVLQMLEKLAKDDRGKIPDLSGNSSPRC